MSKPLSPPPKLKPSQPTSPLDLSAALIPALQKLYKGQNQLNAQWTTSALQDMFSHVLKYPTQTTFGLTIGQFKHDKLHIVEVVPLSHTTTVSTTVLTSGLEITNTRLNKATSLSNFKEEVALFASAGGAAGGMGGMGGMSGGAGMGSQGGGFPSTANANSPPQQQQQPQRGVTMNQFMDSIEDFIKKEEQKLQQQQQQEQHLGDPSNPKSTNIFQQTRDGQAQFIQNMEQNDGFSAIDDQFICGCYVCPAPVPKINSSVLTALATLEPNDKVYQTAAQMYLHQSLRQIPANLLTFFYNLTIQCPNPIFTIIDPIILNINTEAYNQHCAIHTNNIASGKLQPNSPQPPFTPPLPSLTTYFLHDDVLLQVTSEDLMGEKPIADLLFLDQVYTNCSIDLIPQTPTPDPHSTPTPQSLNLSINQEERPHYPTTTMIEAVVWDGIMAMARNEGYMLIIDWQETLSDWWIHQSINQISTAVGISWKKL